MASFGIVLYRVGDIFGNIRHGQIGGFVGSVDQPAPAAPAVVLFAVPPVHRSNVRYSYIGDGISGDGNFMQLKIA